MIDILLSIFMFCCAFAALLAVATMWLAFALMGLEYTWESAKNFRTRYQQRKLDDRNFKTNEELRNDFA